MDNFRYAHNPYLPETQYIPDCEPHVFKDRVYVYGSHDLPDTERYCAGSYAGWSAPVDDLSDWRYEGVLLEKGQDPYDPDGQHDYYASDAVEGADGRYYLYYSINESMVISVAVADGPGGPFRFYGHVKDAEGHVLGADDGDDYQFDPAVLKDDDGRYYLYSGQGLPIPEMNNRKVKGSMVCELADDMMTAITPQITITSQFENRFEENPFFEASSIRKFGGRYYFIYSPLPNTHNLCWAVSDRPDGGFSYGGILISNADLWPDAPDELPKNYWGNNHGSVEKIGDDYFVFYHHPTNRSSFARQGLAEKITMTEDGRFLQAEMTSNGLYGKAYPAKGHFPAYIAWQLERSEVKPFVPFTFMEYDDKDPYIVLGENTEYVANVTDGAEVGYRYFDFDGNVDKVTVTYRGNAEGRIRVLIDGSEVTWLETEAVSDWKIAEAAIDVKKEHAAITFVYEGEGAVDIMEFAFEE